VQLITAQPLLDAEARTWSGPHVVPGQWVIESNAGITGTWLRWFRDTFCHEEVVAARSQKKSAFDLMVELASQAPIGAMGVFALLGPAAMNARRQQSTSAGFGGFVKASPRALLTMPDSKAQFVRALFETFAYSNRANIEQLGAIAHRQWNRVHLCGGMAVGSFWAQMVADVLNREVVVPDIVEGTSIGAAICAGVGVGIYPDFDTAAARLIRSSRVFEPSSEASARYEPLYKNWKYLTREVRTLQPKDEMKQKPQTQGPEMISVSR
jgi:autoinducer-2 kinase